MLRLLYLSRSENDGHSGRGSDHKGNVRSSSAEWEPKNCEQGRGAGFPRNELDSLLLQLFSTACSMDTVSVTAFPATAESANFARYTSYLRWQEISCAWPITTITVSVLHSQYKTNPYCLPSWNPNGNPLSLRPNSSSPLPLQKRATGFSNFPNFFFDPFLFLSNLSRQGGFAAGNTSGF